MMAPLVTPIAYSSLDLSVLKYGSCSENRGVR